ncbi:MAG TPA: M20/M25/M40 family metallo-hydrolase, partial [Vicinamibacterales bacterium]
VSDGRVNIYAHLDAAPRIVFSTHYDCVPPFFPSREERGFVFGRGSCDAKGILAAQVAAAERVRARGESRVGLLFVVGEERGSDGARVANDLAPDGVRFLINGEPTDNRLGAATRGVLRIQLHAAGRAAHSSFPELGESAIDKLLDALMVIRGIQLPQDPLLGRTHYTVGLIEGGVAPNVVSPHASAELLFRIVGDGGHVRAALAPVETLVSIDTVLDIPAVKMQVVSGFDTAVFPYTTDVPLLTRWGTPLLLGPGSIHVAHTDDEHVSIEELYHAVELYERIAIQLLA